MSKSDTLAKLVSTGGPLSDGAITISDIPDLQTTLNGKVSLGGGNVTGDILNTAAYSAPNNDAGAGTTVLIRGSTGTGVAGATGGNGTIQVIGGGGTSSWTSFFSSFARRRGGILLQAGTAQADAGNTYVNGSVVQIFGGAGTNNGTTTGAGGEARLSSGGNTRPDTYTAGGATVHLTGAAAGSGGTAFITAGGYSASVGLTSGASIWAYGGNTTSGGDLVLRAGNADVGLASGSLTLFTGGLERMRVDASGNVAIGTSLPNAKLDVVNTSAGAVATQLQLSNLSSSDGTGSRLLFSAISDGLTATGSIANVRDGSGAYSLRFSTYGGGANTEYMRITTGGIVGLSVAPQSGWGTTSRAVQIGLAASISSSTSGSAVNTSVNAFDSQTGWKYINTAVASNYYQELGAHVWRTAASGTAETAITWTEVGRITTAGAANFIGAITQNNSQVLHAGNYTSYSPTLTGGSASGTWGINVTGNAATVTNGVYTTGTQTIGGAKTFSSNLTVSGTGAAILKTTGDITAYRSGGTTGVIFLNSAETRYLYFDGSLYTMPGGELNVNGQRVLNGGNYTSYAPSLTGSGASGTWGISVTGNAATSSLLNSPDGDRVAGNKLPTTNPRTVRFDFATASSVTGASGNYAGVMTYAPWDGTSASTGDSSYQLAFTNQSGVNASGPPQLLLRNGINSTWNSWHTVITTASTQSAPRATRANGFFYIDDNFGVGVVGNYNASRYQTVYAMGDAYKMAADGASLANMYGIAWSHPNAGGAAGNLTDHGMLIINNGGFRCAISNSIVASGNITAYSDERLKTNWRDMPENFVARLAKVKVGIYDRIDTENGTQVGVSAQSFQELLPQAIITAKDEMQTLSVSYGNAALASAVELAKDNCELRARIERLEALINSILNKD
jgi:hypothetical protein